VKYPQQIISLFSTIAGWVKRFHNLKRGATRADGTISYNDFGAGIMFIPSGLGYYAAGSASFRPTHL
jgi:hypothetical protein